MSGLLERVDDMGVVVAETIEAVEAMRTSWQAAEVGSIDADIDFYLAVVSHSAAVHRPHVVRIRRSGRPDLFGIARIEDLPVALAVGYRTVWRPTMRTVVVSFGGLVGVRTAADEKQLIEELRRPLRTGDAEALLIRALDVDGTPFALATGMVPGVLRVHGRPSSRRWTTELPGSFDEFLGRRSTKTRKKLRWHNRKLEGQYGAALRLRRFDRPEEFDELRRDLETVAAKTYQRGIGAGHLGDELDQALIRTGLRQGRFRAWMLYLDDVPVAFWTGYAHAGTFAVATPGFDPAYTKDSVGRYTMLHMIEELCAEADVTRLDFGHGEAEYKEAFGSATAVEADVFILAARPRAVVLGSLLSTFAVVNGWGRRVARESTWGRKLKRAWRRRLAPSAPPAQDTPS